ncbi:tetratricopeptide repeat protein [Phenylobacterium soli]|uniref:Ancillary SecYEG translocon subunit n=1 Tax=Phenylobacterium soli TaxID=2170551 RepID=A0A328AJP6_9CAUL|nr:tetratricopeptide repeat protein [Phenylobacterium soli]RAK55173.1 hypothetical protein DJ017_11905 [Phenylobacterium soli]
MTDLFEEVEEQLRSDRYRALVIKALPWVLGLAAVLLIAYFGYWGWDRYTTQQDAKASEQYAQAFEALQQGQKDKAVQLWTEVSKSPSKAYKSLALMQIGGVRLADKNTPEAVKYFDQAAAAAPDDIIGDVARLKSAFALLDTAPEKDLEGRLTPLTKDGRPYRVQAREALGFAKLMAGDTAGARGEFVVISQSLEASDASRERAKAAMDLIDSGSAKAIPQVAKAAAALPPPVMLAPGQTMPGPVGPGQAAVPTQPQATGPQ